MLVRADLKAIIFVGMHTSPLSPKKQLPAWAPTLFRWSAISWFVVFLSGQWIFAAYIFFRYWRSGFLGHFEAWNKIAPGLYVKGAPLKSAIFGLHVTIAAIVSLLGPLQVIPALRRYAPRFHRICGRIYIYIAFAMGLDGIVLVWRPSPYGSKLDHLIVSINALIIAFCAFFTIRTAKKRDIPAHNRWAVHLVLAMSGVWLFRVFLRLWLTINNGPVGFDDNSFTGPFLTILGISVYIFPQVLVWGYFQSRGSRSVGLKFQYSLVLLLITVGMTIGLFGAATKMWLPRIHL